MEHLLQLATAVSILTGNVVHYEPPRPLPEISVKYLWEQERLRVEAEKAKLKIDSAKATVRSPQAAPQRAVSGSAPPGGGVWDRLAQCESGGRWNASTGNGYYGGLQWLPSTFHANGGSGNPANASREEQIRVAENLRSKRGFSPWPACAKKLGLR